jgi:hypothetical protein
MLLLTFIVMLVVSMVILLLVVLLVCCCWYHLSVAAIPVLVCIFLVAQHAARAAKSLPLPQSVLAVASPGDALTGHTVGAHIPQTNACFERG